MRPIRVTVSGVAVSAPIPLDYTLPNFQVGIAVRILATADYTVQYTLDDIWSPTFNPATARWYDIPELDALTASAAAELTVPATAVRLNVAVSTGDVTMTVIQSTDTLR